ncbi:glioma pathogenesis-related protein 1b [Chanos chanos]|uniref:Glioma pathogenesis-related protein 1b n=1 Tax=Chanos chanos TaxID=29144 RepID=A0A6J2WNV8_CHACN|nr:GLIPR1-like protein 1 [Chanos chanos]
MNAFYALSWIPALVLRFPGVFAQLPDITEPDFINRCLQAHKAQRDRVSPPASNKRYMTWDDSLARGARAWAQRCKASHNPVVALARRAHPAFNLVEENIWVGEPSIPFSVENAVQTWSSESAAYTHKNNSCTRVCGHFNQLVWAQSYKLGCAVHICSSGIEEFSRSPEGTIFVCNYGIGNVRGFPPFIEGPVCSTCAKTCHNRLCNYDWSPGWDASLPSSSTSFSYQPSDPRFHLLVYPPTNPRLHLSAGLCLFLHYYST